ncbi:MAG: T9SS type A sorting domain-containing protein [Candidatus Eisenbacteria bacterium]|nr:T9SS type A sorting domain-containing protein [Candidatus Eisenbacteria bacterium]
MSSFLSTMTEKSNLQAERWSANRLRRRLNLASFLLLFALPLTSRVALAQSTPDFVWNRGGHGGNPTRATYSPDGTLFATCSIDESTKLWRASDGQLVRTLVGELLPFPGNNTVTGLAFSADGTTLATCAWDYTVKLWRVSDGELLRTITLDGSFWNAVALSPDGQFVCAGGLPSGVIRMWNTGTGALVRSFTGHGDMVNDVEFSPDGTRLASASRDRTVRVWNAATGASLWSATAHDFEAVSIDFSPDGLVLASAGGISQPRVKTWNAATGAPIRTYVGQTNSSNDVEFSPDGSRIGGGGGDGKVRIWNTATGATERVLGVGNPPTICNFDFSPDGAELVAGDSERRVTMWNAASGTLVREASAHPGWVHAVDFAPDGASLATGAFVIPLLCPIKIYDVATGEVSAELGDTPYGLTDIRYSPSGRYLTGSSGSGVTYIVDLSDQTPDYTIPVAAAPDFPWFSRFSPDETKIVTGGTESTIQLWSVASPPQLLDFINFSTADPRSAVFTPDGTQVVIAIGNGVVVWDLLTDQQTIHQFPESQNVSDLAMAPDGQSFFASNGSGTAGAFWIRQVALNGFAELRRFIGHDEAIHSIDLSSDGLYLISGAADFTVRLWSVADGSLLQTYDDECGFSSVVGLSGVPRVVFSPDDRFFAYGRNDGVVALARNPFAPTTAVAGGPPITPLLHPAEPNPFTAETSVRFELASEQSIDLSVFDAGGRRVNTLRSTTSTAGLHAVTWDGRNGAGERVPNGLYWIRLDSPEGVATRRVVVIR